MGDRAQFLFAFNHSAKPADATIALNLPWPVRDARNLADDQKVSFTTGGGRVNVQKKLAPGEIWVLRLEP